MTPHDDAITLQRQIAARQAFPESRGMLALDRVLSRACDGPRRLERLIVGTFATGCAVMWLGWRLGRR